MLQIDVLRHGESELSGVLRGSLDDALTAQGWEQMQQGIAQMLDENTIHVKQAPWQAIWTSPLQRCAKFAMDLSQRFHLPIDHCTGLQEMHFGDWEGQSTAWLYQHYPEQLAEFWQYPTRFTPPQAEPLQQFQHRVLNALNQIVLQMQHLQLQHILIVSHGGVIKLLKCLALQQHLDLILTQSAELGQLQHFYVDTLKQQHFTIRHAESAVLLDF